MTAQRDPLPPGTGPVATGGPPRTSRPGGRRLRQFVFVPLALVALLLLIGLSIARWSYRDYDAHALVRDLSAARGCDWPKAFALAQLLRSGTHDALKDDAALCGALTALLTRALQHPDAGRDELLFQVFLCRIVGEFRVPLGIPTLLDAIAPEPVLHPAPVRTAALESLAVLAGELGPAALTHDPRAVDLLITCTRLPDTGSPDAAALRLAATATFVLGVVGVPAALAHLRHLLDDPQVELRDNAAVGLARHGVPDCVPVLAAMFTDASDRATHAAADPYSAARRLRTAARAVQQLVRNGSAADFQPLRTALDRLADDASIPAEVREEVAAARHMLHGRLSAK